MVGAVAKRVEARRRPSSRLFVAAMSGCSSVMPALARPSVRSRTARMRSAAGAALSSPRPANRPPERFVVPPGRRLFTALVTSDDALTRAVFVLTRWSKDTRPKRSDGRSCSMSNSVVSLQSSSLRSASIDPLRSMTTTTSTSGRRLPSDAAAVMLQLSRRARARCALGRRESAPRLL